VIGSFLHGTMANALPHTIGAQLAYPGRHVISMSGDGGLGEGLAEAEALAHPGPRDGPPGHRPNALSIPPHITAQQVRGFALAGGKTVLDGAVGEMLELARANLRNPPRPGPRSDRRTSSGTAATRSLGSNRRAPASGVRRLSGSGGLAAPPQHLQGREQAHVLALRRRR
jgi:hypothetical protein